MYADTVTNSMKRAIDETNRRRKIQMEYNKKHGITPKTVIKGVRDVIEATHVAEEEQKYTRKKVKTYDPEIIKSTIEQLEKEMKEAAIELQFEKAAKLRDVIFELKKQLEEIV
jgi:excinuclease ABC subunit B